MSNEREVVDKYGGELVEGLKDIQKYINKQYTRKLIYVGGELEELEPRIRKISNKASFNKLFKIYWGMLKPFKRRCIIEVMNNFNDN